MELLFLYASTIYTILSDFLGATIVFTLTSLAFFKEAITEFQNTVTSFENIHLTIVYLVLKVCMDANIY